MTAVRLCLVTHAFPLREGEVPGNFLVPFVGRLRERGWTVDLYLSGAPGGFDADWIARCGIDAVRVLPGARRRPASMRPWRPSDLAFLARLAFRAPRELAAWWEERKTDYALSAWTLPAGDLCRRAARRRPTPFAVWVLGSDLHRYGRMPGLRGRADRALAAADRLFANADVLAREVAARCGRTPDFLPTNRPLPKTGLPEVPVLPGTPNLLFLGRLERVKGADVLLDATAILARAPSPPVLHLLGTGSESGRLRARAARAGIADRVRFHGEVGPAAVAAFLRACDLLVIPSRAEGMPVAFQEGMQMGTPVVATETGDLAAAIREHRLGWTCPPGDPAALAAAIREALAAGHDPDLAERVKPLAARYDVLRGADRFAEGTERGRGFFVGAEFGPGSDPGDTRGRSAPRPNNPGT